VLELTKIRVGISAGDPNGIGFEIILKTFQDEQIYDFFIPIVFAHPQNLIDEQKNLDISVNICSLKDLNKPNEGQLNVVSCWQEAFLQHQFIKKIFNQKLLNSLDIPII